MLVASAREALQLGEQLGLIAGLEEPSRTPQARWIAIHDTAEKNVPADGLARDVPAAHANPGAIDDVLQRKPAAGLDRDHPVQAKP